MNAPLKLISHALCPYVQRAVIVLEEKRIAYERIDIDLGQKPDWFLAVSPLGKTPVLQVAGCAIFESAVICEYLEETTPHPLHRADPLTRARHRSWMEFASAVLQSIAGVYSAPDAAGLEARLADLTSKFAAVESALAAGERRGPYFDGEAFSMVDAAFAPVFRYFDVFDRIDDAALRAHLSLPPAAAAWRAALGQRASVRKAAPDDYPERLRQFLIRRGGELSRRLVGPGAASH